MSAGFSLKSQWVRILLGSLGFLGMVFCAPAPLLPVTQLSEQPGRSFSTRVNVELVTLEVAVLDKNGKPVQNLKKDNFRLYEDGRQQEIYSFDEVNGDAAAGIEEGDSRRGKIVLILFDESSIAPGHLKPARDSAARFVSKHMNRQDLFAVASYDASLKILQNFTREPESVLEAIARPETSSAIPMRPDELPQGPIRGQRLSNMRGPDASGTIGSANKMENLLWALNSFNSSVEHLKGQKSVLIYSESGFFDRSSIDAVYARTINSARRSNVVFYTIDPGGLASGANGEVPEPDVNSDASSSRASLARSPATNNPVSLNPLPSQQSILQSLARDTGQLTIYNTNDLDFELDKLNPRMSNYYVLGFQSNNPKHDEAFRKLEVKTDLKGVTLRHREQYLDRRVIDLLAGSRQEKSLLDAVASPQTAIQIPITSRAAYFYDSPSLARVMILANVPTSKIETRKKGGQQGSDLKIMGVAYAEDGSISARFSETVHFTPDPRRTSVGYRNYFMLRPGKYLLKLVISDAGNNLGSAEQSLDVPALPQSGMAASSLVLAEEVFRQPDLIRNIDASLFDDSDPLVFSGLQISPSVENKLTLDSPLPVFFKLYNINRASNWKLVAKVRLLGDTGEELVSSSIPLDQNISRTGETEATIGITLPFKGLSPGKYKLVIETSTPDSRQAVTVQTDLEFVKAVVSHQ